MKKQGNKKEFLDFREKVRKILDDIGQDNLYYDESEFWMIRHEYEYIQFYAMENQLLNTCIALPLSRGLHNGSHRKSSVTREGVSYRLPYVIHCLLVCRMLLDLNIPLEKDQLDIVLASALCHDMIEDIPFEQDGLEMMTYFHLDPKVYETVKFVSKRRDFTPEEEENHFRQIAEHPLALLVKLSDRGNNVEDLYNMSVWKTHEYVGETRKFFFPMYDYGIAHYPELHKTLEVLQDKILSLTRVAEILVNRYEEMEKELLTQIRAEQKENEKLHEKWLALKA